MVVEVVVERVDAVVDTCAAVLKQSPDACTVFAMTALLQGENVPPLDPAEAEVYMRKVLPSEAHAALGGDSWLSCRAPGNTDDQHK